MPTAHEAIANTLARYCQRCDDGDFVGFADLFERDATFTVMGRDHMGRDSITAFMEASQPPDLRGKHLLGQSAVDVDEEKGLATAATDFVFVSKAFQITSAGRYLDSLRRGPDGEWRFTAREITFLVDPAM